MYFTQKCECFDHTCKRMVVFDTAEEARCLTRDVFVRHPQCRQAVREGETLLATKPGFVLVKPRPERVVFLYKKICIQCPFCRWRSWRSSNQHNSALRCPGCKSRFKVKVKSGETALVG